MPEAKGPSLEERKCNGGQMRAALKTSVLQRPEIIGGIGHESGA